MKFNLKPWNRGISNEQLLEDLRRVAKLLGRTTVTYDEYPQHGLCASRIFETRFGSWNGALRCAGLTLGRRQDISDLELFENLSRVWAALGRQPSRNEMIKPVSSISKGTYERRYGGWRKALEAFVAYANGKATVPASDASPVTAQGSRRFPDLRMRWRVMNRDRFRCQCCGRSPALEHGVVLHVDHVKPWSKGGPTRDDNLRTLCDRCNLGKADLVQTDA
jgi:hypothetical protein